MNTINQCEIDTLIESDQEQVVEKILSKHEKKKLKRKERKINKNKSNSKNKLGLSDEVAEYRKKVKKRVSTNIEHLVPKSRNGSNNPANLKESVIRPHNGKHDYLGVKLFHEQMGQLTDDNFQTLYEETRDEVKDTIMGILQKHLKAGTLYNPVCFRGNKAPRK